VSLNGTLQTPKTCQKAPCLSNKLCLPTLLRKELKTGNGRSEVLLLAMQLPLVDALETHKYAQHKE